MKKIYILILLIAFSSNATFAQNKDTKKADDLYKRLAYTEAAEAYQKLLKKGQDSQYFCRFFGGVLILMAVSHLTTLSSLEYLLCYLLWHHFVAEY